ncbi:Cellulose synthase operon protein C [Vibrio chagasii]|nr:Cellulose synthase operon protein C [Vibrio chagasii]CAH6887228.1 Cellulose synthase operon protein C [Vibrio chagasii]CAH6920682.1 Cellulose synthase operon protein C [Vibrio chagasii]CAH6925888.1 Cellulose synthase operon protein C [Vibrio chagasii]CAH6947883.1 Cellulose synthase operon protein C [Vibrio chagasii]
MGQAMSVRVGSYWLAPVIVASSICSAGTALAVGVDSTPLSEAERELVYQPVQLVQLSSSLERVDSVDWLIKQLKLADAIGRDDIVESTLQRLFAIERANLSGLYYQGTMFLKRKQPELAEQSYERLKDIAPNAPQTQSLSSIMAIQGEKRADYQRARLLAKSGRYVEAIEAYRTVFPNGMPSAALELEYLQLQANLDDNWDKVKVGLERLNADYPGVPQFQLALANHIRKVDPGDPWILDTYRELALAPIVGTSAATSWLRALDQLPISKQVTEQYAVLASYYPSDLEIQKANQSARKRWIQEQELRKDPTYLAKLKGLGLLELGKTEQAEAQLRYAITTRPNDPEILGGMGKVYLRKGQQQKALEYFKQAQLLDKNPDTSSKWTTLVETSQYWAYLDRGDHQLAKGELEEAERLYRKAIALDNTQPYAFVALGALFLEEKKYSLADKAYSQALSLDSLNGSALRGRLDVEVYQGNWHEAREVANQYSPAQKLVVEEKISSIDSEIILSRLRDAIANNDDKAMAESVEALIKLNPDSPWLRLDIAGVVRSMGNKSRADQFMEGWAKDTSDPEMKFAYALYLAQSFRVDQAIAELESVPLQDITASMQRNLTRLRLDSELQGIEIRYQESPKSVSKELLSLEAQYQSQIQPLSRIASAWVDVGETEEADRIYRSIDSSSFLSTDEQLAYGELMVSLNKFEDFDAWFNELAPSFDEQEFTASEFIQFDELRTRRILSEADLMLESENLDRSLALYSRVLSEPEPYKTRAEIGMLRASAMSGDLSVYDQYRPILIKKAGVLSASQLMTTATVFNQQGNVQDANQLNALLDTKADAGALEYRDGMAIAMENRQWVLAEERAYQALNSDRIEKTSQQGTLETLTPSLRDLYNESDDYWLTRNVKSDLDALHDRSDGHIIVGWDYSARDGQNQSNQIPIEARLPIEEWEGHLLLRADYVSIDSGALEYYDKSTNQDVTSFQNSASGMALGIGWQAKNWSADIGTTPVGFDHTTWVGGVSVSGDLGQFGWSAVASRRPETSSTLSYAGMSVPKYSLPSPEMPDPEGTKWGGVVRTGVKFNTSWDIGGPYGFWSSLQYHTLTGESVEDNNRLGVLGGAYYKLISNDHERLSIGTNLIYLGYDKNLGEYSLGHGGYYSPQSYLSVSLPVNYYGRYGNTWSYLLSGSISNSWTQEDAPYLSENGVSDSGGGFGSSFQAAVEKRVSKRWYLGALLDLQRSEFYTPNHFMLYAKYTFNDRWQPIEFPPATPILYSDFY